MTHLNLIETKLYTLDKLKLKLKEWNMAGDKIVFSNGCFDILHMGHIELLAKAADLGDRLIIGLNSDISIQKLKGIERPIISENSRTIIIASLQFVDAVILFSENTPFQLISEINPDFLVKGGDYSPSNAIGGDLIKKNGGEVIIIPLTKGFSSSNIINKIRNG
tara:strand:+ start:462 stop:953 length:492 start_codon:yes stop_codon:yes gene_type:complete